VSAPERRPPDAGSPVVGLHVRVFNWRLKQAREAKGLTIERLAELAGCGRGMVYELQRMEKAPSEALADRLAIILETPVDVLFPEVIEGLLAKRATLEVPLDEAAVARLTTQQRMPRLSSGEMHLRIERVLADLEPRHQRVLRRRFGLASADDPRPDEAIAQTATLEAVAEEEGVPREQVRAMEARALHQLRHPRRARQIRPPWGSDG